MGLLSGSKGGSKVLKVKELNEGLSESLIESLLWNYTYVPKNMIDVGGATENVWFGGYVVGYEVSKIFHDFDSKKDTEDCKTSYNLVLSDGAGFPLSEDSEIFTTTEDEFTEMLAEHIIGGVENASDNRTWGGEGS